MEYEIISKAYEALESTSKRLKKTHIISELLKITDETELETVIMLLKGQIFKDYDVREIGVASKLVVKAITIASGHSTKDIEKLWKKEGDLGKVAEIVMKKKKQNQLFSEDLTIKIVFENLQKLSTIEGIGSVDQKLKTIAKLLSSAKPIEAKFIVRTTLQDLRVGVADGTLRDAIGWAYLKGLNYNYDEEKIAIEPESREEYNEKMTLLQDALNKTNDFVEVAIAAKKGIEELKKIQLKIGKPIKVMLAPKAKTLQEAFKITGTPAALEFKYDGFRMQIHKNKDKITIFTRRLENVTNQFPEVKERILKNVKADSCILDGEATGYDSKTGKYTPFQHISQRIKRKYDIEKLAEKLPVELDIYDILFYEGKELLQTQFEKRREILKNIIKEENKKIVLAKQIITEDENEAQAFFEKSIKLGNEGLMIKNLKSIYKPGVRVGYWVKYKSTMDPMDVVIIGAEWGEGKRSGWLTSFTVACYSDGEFLTLGKVGTGLKEKREEGLSFDEMTEILKPFIFKENGRAVEIKPNVVVSLQFDEIQKSTSYSSGYALRFPRFVALRNDRTPQDISSLEDVEDQFFLQKKN